MITQSIIDLSCPLAIYLVYFMSPCVGKGFFITKLLSMQKSIKFYLLLLLTSSLHLPITLPVSSPPLPTVPLSLPNIVILPLQSTTASLSYTYNSPLFSSSHSHSIHISLSKILSFLYYYPFLFLKSSLILQTNNEYISYSLLLLYITFIPLLYTTVLLYYIV